MSLLFVPVFRFQIRKLWQFSEALLGFSVPRCSRYSERIFKACGRNLRRTHNLNSQIKSVLFKNHGVGVKFRFERLRWEINFDRSRSTTVKSLLGALFAIKRRRGRPLCERAACTLGMESYSKRDLEKCGYAATQTRRMQAVLESLL